MTYECIKMAGKRAAKSSSAKSMRPQRNQLSVEKYKFKSHKQTAKKSVQGGRKHSSRSSLFTTDDTTTTGNSVDSNGMNIIDLMLNFEDSNEHSSEGTSIEQGSQSVISQLNDQLIFPSRNNDILINAEAMGSTDNLSQCAQSSITSKAEQENMGNVYCPNTNQNNGRKERSSIHTADDRAERSFQFSVESFGKCQYHTIKPKYEWVFGPGSDNEKYIATWNYLKPERYTAVFQQIFETFDKGKVLNFAILALRFGSKQTILKKGSSGLEIGKRFLEEYYTLLSKFVDCISELKAHKSKTAVPIFIFLFYLPADLVGIIHKILQSKEIADKRTLLQRYLAYVETINGQLKKKMVLLNRRNPGVKPQKLRTFLNGTAIDVCMINYTLKKHEGNIFSTLRVNVGWVSKVEGQISTRKAERWLKEVPVESLQFYDIP